MFNTQARRALEVVESHREGRAPGDTGVVGAPRAGAGLGSPEAGAALGKVVFLLLGGRVTVEGNQGWGSGLLPGDSQVLRCQLVPRDSPAGAEYSSVGTRSSLLLQPWVLAVLMDKRGPEEAHRRRRAGTPQGKGLVVGHLGQ